MYFNLTSKLCTVTRYKYVFISTVSFNNSKHKIAPYNCKGILMAVNKKRGLLSLPSPLFGYSNVGRWYIPVVTVLIDADPQQVYSCILFSV
jgi:hypothetical protein